MLPDACLILRDGVQQQLVATELVPGDILYIRLGDKLPADVRFLEASPDARFDRSILTGMYFGQWTGRHDKLTQRLGEVVPLRAVAESMEKNYLETPCIGMAGTHCVSGSALGIVVATGDRSVFGRVSNAICDQQLILTQL